MQTRSDQTHCDLPGKNHRIGSRGIPEYHRSFICSGTLTWNTHTVNPVGSSISVGIGESRLHLDSVICVSAATLHVLLILTPATGALDGSTKYFKGDQGCCSKNKVLLGEDEKIRNSTISYWRSVQWMEKERMNRLLLTFVLPTKVPVEFFFILYWGKQVNKHQIGTKK